MVAQLLSWPMSCSRYLGPSMPGLTSQSTVPGGGTYVSGGPYSFNDQTGITTSAGGAGGATAGGAGATSGSNGAGADGGGANGGPATMNPALLSSFVGGASTIRPGDVPGTPDPDFGGGGGALMLVSCHGSVSVDGTLNAGGGGGGPGVIPTGLPLPFFPRGGGAGGNIVIQGRNVAITGQVFANGGGGGEGWQPTQGVAGAQGGDGSMSDVAGASGGNALGGAGIGGNGGWKGLPAGAGKRGSVSGGGPGAGGGSVGFLQVYTPMGTDPVLTPSQVSPAFQPNGVVETR